MAANPSIQLGTDGNWAIKEDNLLAYKKDGTRFFNKEFDFTRNTTATFVDKDGLIKESATNTPRIDFTDDTTGHLLLEPQSTNLIPYSEDFTQWARSNLTTESGYLSPSGDTNATKITATTADPYISYHNVNVTAVTHTASVYVKGVGNSVGKQARILFWYIGTATGSTTSIPFTLTSEWQRVDGSSTPTGAGTLAIRLDFPANTAEVGDVGYLYGFQCEPLSYTTSYIPTFGSTTTRNADVCNNSGSAQDFNSEEGVLYAEFYAQANNTEKWITLSDGTSTNRVIVYIPAANTLRIYVQNSSGGQADFGSSITLSQYNKVAFSYKENDFKLFLNGTKVGSDTSGGVPSGLNRLNLADSNGTTNPFIGKVRDLQVFKRGLSDGELYLLTVPQYQSYQEMATALNYTL